MKMKKNMWVQDIEDTIIFLVRIASVHEFLVTFAPANLQNYTDYYIDYI